MDTPWFLSTKNSATVCFNKGWDSGHAGSLESNAAPYIHGRSPRSTHQDQLAKSEINTSSKPEGAAQPRHRWQADQWHLEAMLLGLGNCLEALKQKYRPDFQVQEACFQVVCWYRARQEWTSSAHHIGTEQDLLHGTCYPTGQPGTWLDFLPAIAFHFPGLLRGEDLSSYVFAFLPW